MKYFFFTLFFPLYLLAQDHTVLTLKGKKGAFPIGSEFYIEKIVDARTHKDSIGLHFRRQVRLNITTKNKLEEEIGLLFKTNFMKSPGKKPIILKINHLFLTDKRKITERISYAELRLSFIVRNPDNSLVELFEATNANIRNDTEFLDDYADGNLKAVVENCVKDFFVRHTNNQLPKPISLSETDLHITTQTELYQFFNNPLKKRGLYQTYYDFRDQTIDTVLEFTDKIIPTDSLKSLYGEKIHARKIKITNNGKALPWGYCDKTYFYVNINGIYHRLYEKDGSLLVNFNVNDVDLDVYFLVFGAGWGGLVGGLLASVVFNEIVDNSNLVKKNKDVSLFKINNISGNPTLVNTNIFNKYTILYDPITEDSQDYPLDIYINGKKKRTIRKGEFIQGEFSKKGEKVEVCIASKNNKQCLTITNDEPENLKIISAYTHYQPTASSVPKDSLIVGLAQSYKHLWKYKNIFDSKSAYTNRTIKRTRFVQDTTELLITKANNGFKEPTLITYNDNELCAISNTEMYKMKVILVEKDPNICFVDDFKRKRCVEFEADLGEKAIILLQEDEKFSMPKLLYKKEDVERFSAEIEFGKTEVCKD